MTVINKRNNYVKPETWKPSKNLGKKNNNLIRYQLQQYNVRI